MTSEQINEGLRLEEKSTQQPWKINTEYKVHDSVQIESSIPHEPIIYRGYEGDGGVCCMEDAEFIVWMRAHARELLECARRCGEMEKEGKIAGLEQAQTLLRMAYMANGMTWGKSKKCKELLELFDSSLSGKIKELKVSV